MIPVGLILLLSPFAAKQESGEYVAKNIAASYLVQRLAGQSDRDPFSEFQPSSLQRGLIPEGFSIFFDPATNRISFKGRAEDIAQVRRWCQMFDVAPMRIELQIEGELPLLGYTYSNSATIGNNGKWTLSEPSRGLEISLSVRLHDDGYALIALQHQFGSIPAKMAVRAKVGDSVTFDQTGSATGDQSTQFVRSPLAGGPPFRLKVTVKRAFGATDK